MLGVNVTYTMKPGKRANFLSEIAACGAQEAVRKEPGCIQYDYFLSAEDPDKLFLLEKWADREAQAVHMNQPHMAQIANIKERYTLDTALDFYQL
ncbi:MAG: putative quinol monooxygenase [Lawsonibacter sp.]|nr:putative quinol monooxygenase [Lawsonibacter sp.]